MPVNKSFCFTLVLIYCCCCCFYSSVNGAAVSSVGELQVIKDDFSAYLDGSIGVPNWNPSSYGLFIQGGRFSVTKTASLFVQHKIASLARDTTFSANVRITSKLPSASKTVWMTGGVSIFKDSSNYWATHLVESPTASGSIHSVELAEKRDGVWLSSSKDAITIPGGFGSSYKWQYDLDYTAKISMTLGGSVSNKSCIATVKAYWSIASNGSVVSSMGWCITSSQGVVVGRGAFSLSNSVISFGNVTSSWSLPYSEPTQTFPAWNSTLSCSSMCSRNATGYFRVEKDSNTGKWWFIDPVGKPFYFVATDHVNYYQFPTEALGGVAEYHVNVSAKYGSESNWANTQVKRLLSWGFNTIAAGCSVYMRYQGLSHTIFHSTDSFSSIVSDITPRTKWTGFPNVFHPLWTDFLSYTFSDYISWRDDPWVLGHFVDNEIQWWGEGCSPGVYCLFNQVWLKEANHTAKSAWGDLIIENFGLTNLESEFLNGWGISGINSRNVLLNHTSPVIPITDRAIEVTRQFVRRVAEIYFRTVSSALKSVDPNHVYLCNRFPGQAPDIMDIVDKYCDVISFNWYPKIEVNLGIPPGISETPEKWVGNYSRPLIITEWSFPALDTGLPSTKGAGMRVDTQVQRAKSFTYFNSFLQSHPLLVGNSYFMMVDEPALGISTDFPENSNYGMVNVNDDPYPLLVQAAKTLNFNVCSRHSGGLIGQYQYRPLISPYNGTVQMSSLVGSIPEGLAYDFGSVKVDGSVVRLSWKGERLVTLRITTGTMLSSESSTVWSSPDTTSSVLQASISPTSASVLIQQEITSRGLVVVILVNVVSFSEGAPMVIVQLESIKNQRKDGKTILVQSITTNGEAHIGDSTWTTAKTQSVVYRPAAYNYWMGVGLYNSTSFKGFGTWFAADKSSTFIQQVDSVTVIHSRVGVDGNGVNLSVNSTHVPSSSIFHIVFPFSIVDGQDVHTHFSDAFTNVQTSFGIPAQIPKVTELVCSKPTPQVSPLVSPQVSAKVSNKVSLSPRVPMGSTNFIVALIIFISLF